MQEIYVENIAEVLRNKKRLERELNIKISNKGKNVFVEGGAENEYLGSEVLRAVNVGFSVVKALQLKKEGFLLQVLNIKDLTKRRDLERVRGRIIGTSGKTLKTLHNLTECDISLKDNKIGILGDSNEIEDAVQSLTLLVQGSKQGNVYARLEKQRKRKRLKNRSLNIENKNINLINKKLF